MTTRLLTTSFPALWMLVALLSGSGCGVQSESNSEADRGIGVGFFIGDDVIASSQSNEIFTEYLAERLGRDVTLFTGTSYTTVIEAMRAGRIDAMSVGPFAHCFASREANAEAIAVIMNNETTPVVFDASKEPFYYSLIITQKGSGIQTLDDLRGRSFSFVDHVSTSGRLFPSALLIRAGLDPEDDIQPHFAGTHAASITTVFSGTVDAAACAAYLVDRLPEDQKARVSAVARRGAWTPLTQEEIDSQFVDDGLPEDTIVVVAQSAPIPRTPFAVRADMEPALKSQIRDALLAIQHDPELIARIGRWYEDPTEEVGLESLERFYDPVRETAQLLNLDLSAIQ